MKKLVCFIALCLMLSIDIGSPAIINNSLSLIPDVFAAKKDKPPKEKGGKGQKGKKGKKDKKPKTPPTIPELSGIWMIIAGGGAAGIGYMIAKKMRKK